MFDEPKPSQSNLAIKIKLAVLALMSLGIFYYAWQWVRPANPALPVSIAGHVNIGMAVIIATIIGIILTVIGYKITGKHGPYIAFLGIPFGLGLWSILGGNVEAIFVRMDNLSDQKAIYLQFIIESILWCIPVLAGLIVTNLMIIKQSKTNNDLKESERFIDFLSGIKNWQNLLKATSLTAILSVIFLVILSKAQYEKFIQLDHSAVKLSVVITTGQAIFSIVTSFCLATLIVHQFFRLGIINFFPSIILTSFIIYTYGKFIQGGDSDNIPAVFVTPHGVVSTILPIILVAFGVPAITWGYSQSCQMYKSREKIV